MVKRVLFLILYTQSGEIRNTDFEVEGLDFCRHVSYFEGSLLGVDVFLTIVRRTYTYRSQACFLI